MTNPLITFVAPSCGEEKHNCPLVNALLAQRSSAWKLIVFNNGPNADMKAWIEDIGDDRISYRESDTNTGNWGTANRQTAIDTLVDTPWLINTSVQDYYTPNTVGDITEVLKQGADLVHWQAINHLFRYCVLNGEIAWGHIDWGQWCIRTDIIKSTSIVNADNFSSDWHTLQAIAQSGKLQVIYKLDKILTVHN